MTSRFLLVLLVGIACGVGPIEPPYPFDLEERLVGLTPERPAAYFELGEEVLDVAGDDDTRRALARRLFGLAGVLDPRGLGPSSALALAAMSDTDPAARRYRVIARLLSGDVESGGGGERAALDRDVVSQICRALEDFRAGKVDRLRAVLRDPAKVRALALVDAVVPGGVGWLKERSEEGNAAVRSLDPRDRLALVEVEIALLEGAEASWATLILSGTARPLVDLPLDRPEEALLREGEATPYWREGIWVDRPGP